MGKDKTTKEKNISKLRLRNQRYRSTKTVRFIWYTIIPRSNVWWVGWKSMLVTVEPWCSVKATILGRSSNDQEACCLGAGYVTWKIYSDMRKPILILNHWKSHKDTKLKKINSRDYMHNIRTRGKSYLFNRLSRPQSLN